MVAKHGELTRACAAALALLLAGCTMLAPATNVPASRSAPATTSEAAEAGVDAVADGAITGAEAGRLLLRQSRAERAAGNYADAAASLERALRIDPQDPLLWLELGYVKLAEGDRAQAQTMAQRALTLANGDRDVQSSARRLLALSQSP